MREVAMSRGLTCLLAWLALSTATLVADRVQLRDGKVVEGTFVGADSKSIRLLLGNGQRAAIPVEQVMSVTFSVRKPPPPPPDPKKPVAVVTVPAGTTINVRLTQDIDVDASKAGMQFTSIVDDPVMLNGNIVVPRGARAALQAVRVEQSGKMKGADKITLKMNTLAFGGRQYDVVTQYLESSGKGEGRRTARKVGGGAGLGAVIGGIAGGGEGAAIGAAVGGVAGAVVASSGEEHLRLPSETRLQFQLSAAVAIQP
jgi:hypothetical protein